MGLTVLSSAERHKIQQICNTRHNWTDGGHWVGRGKQPDCYSSRIKRNTLSIALLFNSDEAAMDWNRNCDKNLRVASYSTAIGINIALAFVPQILPLKISKAMSSAWGAIVTGSTVNVMHGEGMARIPYPEVAKGWKVIIEISHELSWVPMLGAKSHFTQKLVALSVDSSGKERFSTSTKRQVKLSDMPAGLAEGLVNIQSQSKEIPYSWRG